MQIDGGRLENCHSLNNTIERSKNAGGLLCDAVSGTQVYYCSNTSSVKCTSTSNNWDTGAGGIVGSGIDGSYNSSNAAEIVSCFNSGNITSSEKAGGIAARIVDTEIDSCYNSGTITCNGNVQNSSIGGILGELQNNKVTKCYNVGEVTGTATYIGELVGYATNDIIDNCYYIDGKTAIGHVYNPEASDYVEGDEYYIFLSSIIVLKKNAYLVTIHSCFNLLN